MATAVVAAAHLADEQVDHLYKAHAPRAIGQLIEGAEPELRDHGADGPPDLVVRLPAAKRGGGGRYQRAVQGAHQRAHALPSDRRPLPARYQGTVERSTQPRPRSCP